MAKYSSMLRVAYLFFIFLLFTFQAFSKIQSEIEQKVQDILKQELYDSALVTINEHFLDIKNFTSEDQADAYFTRGVVRYHIDDYYNAISDFRQSIELYKISDHLERYRARSRIVRCYKETYDMDSMKTELDILLLNDEYGDSLSRANTYFGMHQYYQRGADKHIALEYIMKARELFAGLGRHKKAATFDAYIGVMYYSLDNDSLAEFYQNRSLAYHLENENFNDASYVYLERGSYYNGIEKWDLAEKDLLECLRLSEITGNASNIANANQFLACTYAFTGRYKESEEALDLSMEICDQYDIDVCRVFAYMYYADLFHKSGDYDRSIAYGKMLVAYPTELYMNEVYEGYGILAQAYADKGDFKNAYDAMELERELRDSLYNIDKDEAMAELKEQYEREKNTAEITKLKNEAALEAMKKKGLTWGLGILGLMSLVIINREVQRRKKARQLHEAEINLKELEEKRLKDELIYKNRELTTKALHVAKKNEVLQRLRSQLEVLAHENGAQECVREVVNTLKLEKSIDGNWDQFTQQFTDLNPTFYKELIGRFPGLTKSELRLAALLRMNLSSKEIGNMLNISDSGVKKARQRIRKKLELQSDESLETYILSV